MPSLLHRYWHSTLNKSPCPPWRKADSQQESYVSQPSSAGFGFRVIKYAWRPVHTPNARLHRKGWSLETSLKLVAPSPAWPSLWDTNSDWCTYEKILHRYRQDHQGSAEPLVPCPITWPTEGQLTTDLPNVMPYVFTFPPAVNQHAPSLWSFVYVKESILNARCSFKPKFNASYSCEVEIVIVLYGKVHGFLVWTHPSLMHMVDRTPDYLVLWEILRSRVDLAYFSI